MDKDFIAQIELGAKSLAVLFNSNFGGKKGGKFKVREDRLAEILGINFITPRILEALINAAYSEGLVICRLPEGFTVFSADSAKKARSVPNSAVKAVVKEFNTRVKDLRPSQPPPPPKGHKQSIILQ